MLFRAQMHKLQSFSLWYQALYSVSQCRCYKTENRVGRGQLLLYVPKLKKLTAEHYLVQVLGDVDAQKLSTVFGGELLVLSHCHQMILSTRNEGIKNIMKNGFSITDLVDFFNVTERIVLKILKSEFYQNQLDLKL